MPHRIPWTRTLGTRLGALSLALLAVSLTLIAGNLYLLANLQQNASALDLAAHGRRWGYEMAYLLCRYGNESPAARVRTAATLRDVMTSLDHRFDQLRNGDPSLGIEPADDPIAVARLGENEQAWRNQIRPAIERVLAADQSSAIAEELAMVDRELPPFIQRIDQTAERYTVDSANQVQQFRRVQWLFAGIVLVIVSVVVWTAVNVGRRARALAATAVQIAGGDLALTAPVSGTDELAAAGHAFNAMTASLRQTIEREHQARVRLEGLVAAIRDTVNSLGSATAEILAGTAQQASSAQEQAAAVAETVTTVDQVLQTSEQATMRAKAVADTSQRAAEAGRAGRKSVDDTVAGMSVVRTRVETIAESIVALAERAQAIGEIIATVNDIAEQTNLLALNAAIEASRAGEHGRGFGVVAAEIKALADQSKRATSQVRQILGEIQRATQSAVMATEEGTKSSTHAIRVVGEAGDTIKVLAETVNEAAQAAAQIVASAGQQAAGMTQIHRAMRNIDQATSQTLAAVRQAERAAQDLNALGTRLQEMMAAQDRAT